MSVKKTISRTVRNMQPDPRQAATGVIVSFRRGADEVFLELCGYGRGRMVLLFVALILVVLVLGKVVQ